MRVLALDTSTRARTVALVEDDRILAERHGDPLRTHAESLPGDILSVLDAAGVGLSSVDVFAVAAGPGSFTGLRIGIATIQGLAFVNRRRIVAVSALEALAQAGCLDLPQSATVAAWMDAHRRDVFSALYQVADRPAFSQARLVQIDSAAVGDPAGTLSRWSSLVGVPNVVVGDGAVLYADVIAGQSLVKPSPALAVTLGLMAVDRAKAGDTVDPAGVEPLYVRRPDAEIARERDRT